MSRNREGRPSITRKIRRTAIAAVIGLSGALSTASEAKSSTPINPTSTVLMTGEAVRKNGPVLIDPSISRGVNCGPETLSPLPKNSPLWTRHDSLKVQSQPLNPPFDRLSADTGYVGLDEGVAMQYGYYPLIAGWALRGLKLYHFTLGDYETRPSIDGTLTTAKMYGEEIANLNIVGLTLKGSEGWSDGNTDLTVSTALDITAFNPSIRMDIQCAQTGASYQASGF
jgi:hypothetical protein